MTHSPLFNSFFLGGIECSTHRLRNGKRLDVIAATQHDRYVEGDYLRLQAQGIRTIRSGFRWHQIETSPYQYDFSSALAQIRAAQKRGMQVIWDFCHYGWPDDLDIFSPAFVKRFAAYSRALAEVLLQETTSTPFICPINEISFFSWGGGDVGYLNPFAHGRGFELKVQLVRATIEAVDAIWSVAPNARIVHVDPVINVINDPSRPGEFDVAEGHRLAQYQSWDMLSGRMWPQLGGAPKYLDIIGVNYYQNNQWIHGGPPIYRFHPLYRPFRSIIAEVHQRYARPVFVAETGAENEERPLWLRYMAEEVRAARRAGTPVEGICLYPILNHPGWDDDRHCHNGLWDYCDDDGERELYAPLAEEIARQRPLFERARKSRLVKV